MTENSLESKSCEPTNSSATAAGTPAGTQVLSLSEARQRVVSLAQESTSPHASSCLERALAVSAIVEPLHIGDEILIGALVYPLVEGGLLSKRAVSKEFGQETAGIVRELLRLGSFGFPASWEPEKGLSPAQAETLRKMLLAIVADVRLVLVRLADQLHRLRSLKRASVAEQRRAALETREIHAPLANRLGVWQLKWELEDMAFRYLEPQTYKKLAAALRERRADRERYIKKVIGYLTEALSQAGIRARIAGRPKHIYSIWRKMQRKGVEFEHIFDIRAVRILVDTVGDCYAALGIVHSHWRYLPGEFDDYIATPKENLYRSLHTAVVGPDDQPLEIQIRTEEMHQHAELGVAAHWRYKEGSRANPAFEQKIAWLRRLLEPGEAGENERDFIDRVKSEIFEDRVYAVSPKGDVVDLPKGATPLDFAYHVHTDIGHHCRGAKVNGRMVPLTYQIINGDQIEIITSPHAKPSRDWLIPQLGFLASARTRSKVRAYFRQQNKEINRKQGRAMLERELNRLGLKEYPVAKLAKALKLQTPEQLHRAVGEGEITLAAVATAIQRSLEPARERAIQKRRTGSKPRSHTSVTVRGLGGLMSQFARCCRPVPPEPIAGYITQGRGVSIHREDCTNMLRLSHQTPERVIAVSWSDGQDHTYPVDILIEAYDRQGLIKDVSTLLADEQISILGISSRIDKATNSADLDLSIEITGLDELSRVLHRLGRLPNVVNVVRKN